MEFATARRNMIDCQIRHNKVTDPAIIDALADIPRERFVPEALRCVAYVDEDVPIGGGRFLMEPMILGRLLQLSAMRPSDSVLVVGAGTCYAAVVAARIARQVVALESDRSLAAHGAVLLRELGIDNVAVVEGRLGGGAPQSAPYDVILFDGAIEVVPREIQDQLAEGGRLVAVINDAGIGRATLMARMAGLLSRRVAFDASVPCLPGLKAPPAFVF